MRAVLIADDTVVPPADHGTKFLAKVAPYTSEASTKAIATGGHIPTAAFDAAEVLSFFGRCAPVG